MLHAARERFEGLPVGLFGGERERTHGAAVETAVERKDPAAFCSRLGRAAVTAGKLESRLHCFGAGVCEEDPGTIRCPREIKQFFGERNLGGAGEKVGDMPQGGELAADHRRDKGMGVAQRVDGDTAQQVKVLISVRIPDVAAGAADQYALRSAENSQERPSVAFQPLLAGCFLDLGQFCLRHFIHAVTSSSGTTWVPIPAVVKTSSNME